MKCALVTGGSRGIGRAICQKLAEELNYHVLINYQGNKDAALETLALLEATGATGEILQFNVADIQETQAALQNWSVRNPEAVVEVIINNAGIARDGLFMWMSPDDWSSVLQVSLQGFYNVTNFFIQKLLRQRFGRIINIVSVSGVKGTAGQVNYSAAKAGVVGATKALALEVAKRNITVNAVAPGFIHTDMTAEMDEGELVKLIPANRFGKAEEVADLVCFLASKKSGYITGEVININGGIYS
ncbi:3-oxoacyl-[acyl-carrier protein] reductase [Sphingobacterium allocomposti]|uniref:3-oxoacyl-[acyl-carrier protein] reductase n=1 Tax=Sphingobacterium allocomposti TaxID=415956 RepID=A0A5S5DJR7_9SPHI|nr:3-oxoacyl-ACP reductase FabG [Sphingobacterium composti Yoo et al. 2007 non Ten et al. 2007]TYP95925.1 3-oxoacyl-[acyl-carrier protein] reductase [Sphingobacterium composti Yoo et al. 2007 non Ten et al. 2007]